MNKKFFLFCSFVLINLILCLSCSSLSKKEQQPKAPKTVVENLDYSQQDVINNEIENIRSLCKTLPVKALWRAMFLDNPEIEKECVDAALTYARNAYADDEYYEVNKILVSLKNCGYDFYSEFDLTNSKKYIIPGFIKNTDKLPKTIEDCVKATATIWVDRGLKVQNGAGYTDIVIGSGFFIDSRGYLITNHHVISSMVDPKYEGYSRLYIKLPGDMETKIPAKVIGYDSVIDLALLKVEIEPEFVFELGSSSDLAIGDKVSVIGTPLGLEGTLTSGIISSIDRKLTTMGNVFQLDAAVNSGNSGGPLIDKDFKVQAIVFAGMLQFQGLNFAIPVEYLKQELPMLYEGNEYKHAWIGAYGHTKKTRSVKEGLEIQYVMPGGSGKFAGLKEDYIIKELDGCLINSLEDFQYIVMKYPYDTILTCKYCDENDELQETLIYLDKRPEYPLEEIYRSDFVTDSFIPIFGMKMVSSSTINRKSYSIIKVINGSAADENGFSINDPVTVQDVQFDYENQYFMAQLYVKRKKKGFIDIVMVLGAALDSPYYF